MRREHLTIQSGEQFLPFARARIKALRSNGSEFASQRFDIGGASVAVRISGIDEYIDIRGGGAISMDSGCVEIDITTASPPKLIETEYVTEYIAELKLGGVKDRNGDLFYSNSKAKNQLAGTVRYGALFSGEVPGNNQSATSFYPLQTIDSTVEPPKSIPDEQEDGYLKKRGTTAAIPASIFTGKTRLYVQSMYGAWLHDKTNECPQLTASPRPYGAPGLSIKEYGYKKNKTQYPLDLVITTSSGVFLDKNTGRHWLIQPPGVSGSVDTIDYAYMYPLVSSAIGESWRKLLTTVAAEKSGLSDEDRTHIEAYILSRCEPDRSKEQKVYCGASPQAFSLGYGWHFNWSGTEATLTTTKTYLANPGDPTSTLLTGRTWGLSVKSITDEGGLTSLSLVLAAGPESSYLFSRTFSTILQANFQTMAQEKIIPRLSGFHAGEAPVYSYYAGDELKVISVSVAYLPETYTTDTSPGYDISSRGSIGLRDGFTKSKNRVESWEVALSCSGIGVIGKNTYELSSYFLDSVQDKAIVGRVSNSGFYFTSEWRPNGAVEMVRVGYPDSDGVYGKKRVEGQAWVKRQTDMVSGVSFNQITSTTVVNSFGWFALAIPIDDAEAIVVRNSTSSNTITTGTKTTYTASDSTSALYAATGWVLTDFYLGVTMYPPPLDYAVDTSIPFDFQYFDRYQYSGLPSMAGMYTTSTSEPDDSPDAEVPVNFSATKIYCGRAGEVNLPIPPSLDPLGSALFENEEWGDLFYPAVDVRSGTDIGSPIFSNAFRVCEKMHEIDDAPNTFNKYPVFVGWT